MIPIPAEHAPQAGRHFTRFATRWAWDLVLLVLIGCGQPDANRGVVSGEVKLDRQPLAQGSIAFVPTDGTKGVATGGQIEQGRYRLSGNAAPMVGWNRVEIRAVRKSGRMVQKPFSAQGEMTEESVEAVAPHYNTASTLKVEIKSGENTADFTVTSK
jgi:hypothetical protein